MATTIVKANARSSQGTGASRRLRRDGKVPAVLYGGHKDARMIEVDHKDTLMNLKHEAFHSSILDMDIDGEKEKVLLRDVQMHPWKSQILHIDFQRVSAKEKIHMKVPLHFINEEIAPGVKIGGGLINHIASEIDITCLPADLPEYIEVDLGALEVGESIHLSQIKFPSGVESVQLARGGEDLGIVAIQAPRGGASSDEVGDGAVATEGAEDSATEQQKANAQSETK
ncbi:MAG: 50S ribosomal protein L25/general stress protein Ctc [Burkholderiales bacterium]|jgi:large subunit ribosomal protein L25